MNPIGWVQGLEGLTLALVICGLLFLEEVGVPLPFAPGDLLLAIAGIAVAAGRVPALMMVGLALGSIVGGALLGREIFALLGWPRVMRLADRLHARAPLERASQMLERNGWRAVFTARLIPGLRVHTTQVAGLNRMPRLEFLAGLVPAAAVYVGAFLGLGFAFGRPILTVIHDAERQALYVIGVMVVGAILLLWLRRRAQQTLESLGGWSGILKFRPGTPGVALIPVCIGLNVTGHAIAVALKLPLFGDSIGTVLGAVLGGPWVGASIGLITNFVSSNTVDPIAAPYAVVSVAIGFGAGLVGYLDQRRRLADWIALWSVCVLLASLLSTPLNLLLNGGRSGVALGDTLYAYLVGAHLPTFLASFLAEAAIDVPDKLLAVLAALLIYRALPTRATEPAGVELDIGRAFVFVFRSRRWLAKLLVGALCLVFFWLVVPLLLFAGYAVAVARRARAGDHQLPAWDRLGEKLRDGFMITALFLVWNLPGLLLGVPTELVAAGASGGGGGSEGSDLLNRAFGALATLGGLWSLAVLILQSAIWGQYLQGGFGAALNVAAVLRRLRYNAGLTIVVGALAIVLSALAASGFAILIGGLVTLPYAAFVSAHLFGSYSRQTDEAVAVARPVVAPA
jgi:energy-coupling factor transport system substrate-specific component